MIDRARWRLQVTVSMLVAAVGCSSESHDVGTTGEPTTGGSGGTASGGANSTDGKNASTAASSASGGSDATSDSDTGAGGNNSTSSATGGAGSGGEAAATGAAGDTGSDEAYANVVAVAASGSAGAYTFNVSVESSDIDCSQFANWWEVVSEDGELLYRRILEHSHTDENGTTDADAPGNTFTRSGGPVDIQADELVFVRAHLSTLDHYHGDVMQGSINAGFTPATDLSSDFAVDLLSADPQPEGCLF